MTVGLVFPNTPSADSTDCLRYGSRIQQLDALVLMLLISDSRFGVTPFRKTLPS